MSFLKSEFDLAGATTLTFCEEMTIRSAHKALKRATSRGLDGPWKRYTMRGGSGDRRWTTTGIMKDQVGVDGRIVLEAFSSRAYPDIIVRVFSEDPLEIFHARRVTSTRDIDGCVTEATTVFDRIPGECPQDLGLLGGVFNVLFRGALNPPPPPFDIDKIQVYSAAKTDTEQVGTSNGG
jgi:hypothetical protein